MNVFLVKKKRVSGCSARWQEARFRVWPAGQTNHCSEAMIIGGVWEQLLRLLHRTAPQMKNEDHFRNTDNTANPFRGYSAQKKKDVNVGHWPDQHGVTNRDAHTNIYVSNKTRERCKWLQPTQLAQCKRDTDFDGDEYKCNGATMLCRGTLCNKKTISYGLLRCISLLNTDIMISLWSDELTFNMEIIVFYMDFVTLKWSRKIGLKPLLLWKTGHNQDLIHLGCYGMLQKLWNFIM